VSYDGRRQRHIVPTMVALSAAYSAACLSWSTQPFQFPVLSVQSGFGDVAAGWVLSCEICLAALVSMVLGFLGNARPTRKLLLTATLLTVIGCLLAAVFVSFASVLLARAIAGVGEGIMIAAVNASIAAIDFPEKRYGQINAIMGLAGFLIVLGMPHALGVLHLRGAVFAILAIATLICLPLIALFPVRKAVGSMSATYGLGGWRGWAVCTAVLLSSTAVGSFYPSTESLGQAAGIPPAALGFVLSLAFIGSIIGSYMAAWLDERLGILGGALLVAAGLTASVSLLVHAHGVVQFGAGMFFFGVFWFHGLMTCLGLAAMVDRGGGCAAAAGGTFFLGGGVGPLLGGYELDWSGGNIGSFGWSVGALMAGFLLLVGLVHAHRSAPTHNGLA
jgi:predicted MFS family arabinose efflux permease